MENMSAEDTLFQISVNFELFEGTAVQESQAWMSILSDQKWVERFACQCIGEELREGEVIYDLGVFFSIPLSETMLPHH